MPKNTMKSLVLDLSKLSPELLAQLTAAQPSKEDIVSKLRDIKEEAALLRAEVDKATQLLTSNRERLNTVLAEFSQLAKTGRDLGINPDSLPERPKSRRGRHVEVIPQAVQVTADESASEKLERAVLANVKVNKR